MSVAGPTLEQLKTRLSQLLHSADAFAETVYRSSTSAAGPKGHNLLVFPGNLQPGSEIRLLHANHLTK